MSWRPVVVAGATGSIGLQTLSVCSHLGIEVRALIARNSGPELLAASSGFDDAVLIATGGTSQEHAWLRDAAGGKRVEFGLDAALAAASTAGVTVVNGVVGAGGLGISMATLTAGNRLALANKESMVIAGDLVMNLVSSHGGELIPVDSEHSALFQLVAGHTPKKLILTASGGPFRGWARAALEDVTPQQALAHPTWRMGNRISVDSATMVNKALEVIEAHHLFGIGYDDIEVLVHPQSIVHSMLELDDHSIVAHMGITDMKVPIQLALTYPDRLTPPVSEFSLVGKALTFEAPDRSSFPALDLGYLAGRSGGGTPAVYNAADEVAVEAFLQGRIGFTTIVSVIERAVTTMGGRNLGSVDEAFEIDREARALAASLVSRC